MCNFKIGKITALSYRARLHKTRSELKPCWNLKPLWKVVPFTWQFHCGNVQMIAFKSMFTWETRSELKPVWDFTSVQIPLRSNFTLVKMNSSRFEISLWCKISLRCEITSLSAFTYFRASWNSLQCKFYFGQFSLWSKWTQTGLTIHFGVKFHFDVR